MIDFLLSVPGRCTAILNGVNTILARLSAAQSSYIDAPISSRAPGSTALTNTTWTDSRAAALDNVSALTANIASLLNSPVLSSPTAMTAPQNYANLSGLAVPGVNNHNASVVTAGTWQTVINENGRGCIDFLALMRGTVAGANAVQARVTIDGLVLTIANSSLYQNARGVIIVGAASLKDDGTPNGVVFEKIPFLTSFKVEVQGGQLGDSFNVLHKYYRTG